jgi:hypothetical protein
MSFLLYLAGLVLIATVASFVSWPLFFWKQWPTSVSENDSPTERWRRQKEEAYVAIKEAEFDWQMGKLSEEDYHLLRTRYEARALEAMAQLDQVSRQSSAAEPEPSAPAPIPNS